MSEQETDGKGTNYVLARNIHTLLALKRKEELKAALHVRFADWVAAFAGSMTFLGSQIIFFAVWTAINLGWTGLPRFDPTFVGMATAASVEAILLTTFVLISQKRLSEHTENHAHLNLQISLLAEHEITHILHLVSKLAAVSGIKSEYTADVEELKRHVEPEAVMECIAREKLNISQVQ